MLALFAAALGVGPLNASAAPTSTYGNGGGFATVTVQTDTSTVSVSGGTPPYTYAWSRISGVTLFNPTAASSASSAFTRNSLPVGGNDTATFVCTVTDAAARTTQTNAVTATVENV